MVSAMTGMITSNKLFEAGVWEDNFSAILIAVLVSVVCSTVTAVVTERIAYRPLRGSPPHSADRPIGVSFLSRTPLQCCSGRGQELPPP